MSPTTDSSGDERTQLDAKEHECQRDEAAHEVFVHPRIHRNSHRRLPFLAARPSCCHEDDYLPGPGA